MKITVDHVVTVDRAVADGIPAKRLIDVAKWHEGRKGARHATIAQNLREVAREVAK